jgi:hypothetical protein
MALSAFTFSCEESTVAVAGASAWQPAMIATKANVVIFLWFIRTPFDPLVLGNESML